MSEQSRNRYTSCQQMGEHTKELRKVNKLKMTTNDITFSVDLALIGSEFQRVVMELSLAYLSSSLFLMI